MPDFDNSSILRLRCEGGPQESRVSGSRTRFWMSARISLTAAAARTVSPHLRAARRPSLHDPVGCHPELLPSP